MMNIKIFTLHVVFIKFVGSKNASFQETPCIQYMHNAMHDRPKSRSKSSYSLAHSDINDENIKYTTQ